MLRKEQIEALRGLGIRSSISGVKNLSGSKSKPNSVIKLPSSKDKSKSATSSLKSNSKPKGEAHCVILAPFSLYFILFFADVILLLM